jgi:uncharacterized damage-inducible protein DinB
MLPTDPLQILLDHDHWATTQILLACRPLPPDQFHRRVDIGPGSLHDPLTHIVGTTRSLTETLAGIPLRPRLESDGQRRTPDDLLSLLDQTARDFQAQAHRLPLDQTVTRTTASGKSLNMTRAAVLVHVATHGMHLRAQCLNMLRHLGVTPLPPSSVAEWTWFADAK